MKRLGFALASIHTGSSLGLLPAVIRDAAKLDVPLFIFPGGRLDSRPDQEYLRNGIYRLANGENIDGLVCWGSSIGGAVSVSELDRFHKGFDPLPYVTIAHKMEGHPCVCFDAYGGMKALVLHFIRVHGSRRIAFIRGPETHASSQDRFNGYRDALKESGLPDAAGTPLVTDPFPWNSGEAAIAQLYTERSLIPGRDFDTLLCSSDMMAFAAVRFLERLGYRVPDDYRVGGFNDSRESRILTSPLTTVRMPFKELGTKAVSLLLSLLGEDRPHRVGGTGGSLADLVLPTEPVIRESCGCAGSLEIPRTETRPPGESLADALRELFRLDLGDREAFIDPLLDAVRGGDMPLFFRLLERVLTRFFEGGGDVAVLREAVSLAFSPGALPLDPSSSLAAERRVYYLSGKVQQRLAALRHYETARRQSVLNSLKNDLLCARDRDSLVPVLALHLPAINMTSVAVVLHETEDLSRCLGWFTPEGLFRAPGTPFPARRLLPPAAGDLFQTGAFLVQPLFMENQPLGYIVHNVPFDDGAIYEELRSALGSALKGIFLFEETLRAKRAAEEAETAKTDFFARIGSDLVDPLESMLCDIDSAEPTEEVSRIRGAVAAHLERTRRYIDVTLSLTNELALELRLFYLDTLLGEAAGMPPIHADRDRLERAISAVRARFDGPVRAEAQAEGISLSFTSSAPVDPSLWSSGDLLLAERVVILHGGDFTRGTDRCRMLLRWPTLSGVFSDRNREGERKTLLLPGGRPRIVSGPEAPFRSVADWDERQPDRDYRGSVLIWNAEGAALEDRIGVLSLRHNPELFNAPFVYEGPRLSGESLFSAVESAVTGASRGPVLFVGLNHGDFPLWHDPGQALAIPSMADFSVTVESVVPSLVVLPSADSASVSRIRENPATVHVPVAALPERIESEAEVDALCRQPLVILLNRGVAGSAEVSRRMRSIAAGSDILPPHTGALVKRAILYMNLHYASQIARWKLADTVNVSEDYLTRIFHREVGLSLWEYLNRYRIFLATDMLLHTNDTISEISLRAGFQDQAYFCRVFKKLHGIPPGKIRAKKSE